MPINVIETRGLVKDFGDFRAVDHLDLNIEEGKITGLLGPNGAGKTTTIQMLLDIITPTEGTIKIFGKEFPRFKEQALAKMNFSSPYVSLPTNLTVIENLLTFARLYSVPNPKKKIAELADFFEIQHLLPRITMSLSTGQLTRVNLTKAFINDPKLLLLDEATASLDPDIADKTRKALKKIQSERGVSILYTSHNMVEIEELCDYVIFINKGKIREEGTAKELVEKFGHKDLNDVFITIAREED
ncbi:MAG TPA: ABC transporter ATP-binding protein [Candidatus Paceibacterota bacterium]